MNNKIEINFICYAYTWNEGTGTIDEVKAIIESA